MEPPGKPVAPSWTPVGRNRSEAIVFCFAVALSARLRSNTLASPSSPPKGGASGEGG